MASKAGFRRTTSAGYRLPDRLATGLTSHSSTSVHRQQPGKTRSTGGGPAPEPDPDTRDPVKQDQVWREYIQTEWTGVKQWKKNWGFLTDYDQLVPVREGKGKSCSLCPRKLGKKVREERATCKKPVCPTHSIKQGRPRTEVPLPSHVPLFSDQVPNTTNQAFGSRTRTDLGQELIRMDNLLLQNSAHRKTKPSPEMQPC